MCGILGGNNEKWDYQSAIKKLFHRGPDAVSIHKARHFTFAFTRLSVIDLNNNAMQPMVSKDKRYTIVFNGEIYDYGKVRDRLIQSGYVFKTKSDTEVLLYAFSNWREKLVEYIDGIFAFAIYDELERKLYLFRDRCGVKPLYYYENGRDFAFASELKAFEQLGTDIQLTLDNTALYDYHTYLYIPEPKSMYREVKKLPAASMLVYDIEARRILSIKKYWKVCLNSKAGNPLSEKEMDDKASELKFHLCNAVKRQVVADVPVGTFLSGGVDSSIITAETKNNVNRQIAAFSIGFSDRRYDESKYAREAAKLLGVQLHLKTFESSDFSRLYFKLKEMFDEPFADTSAYPTYFVSTYAKEQVTVVLTGDGGDELFGGYARCAYCRDTLQKRKYTNKIISDLYIKYARELDLFGGCFDQILEEDLAMLAPWYAKIDFSERKRLRKKFGIPREYDDFWYYRKYYHKDLPPYTRMRYLDFMTYLNGDILTKVDRTSMAASLEARVPFLDREVVDFAFSLTEQECNPNGELKGLLKHAYRNEIQKEFFDRKKQGFSIPVSYISKKAGPQEKLIYDLWKL
ncbi:asparagine synthase (glutamine-hydrolyzing) [Acetatifactor muris]|uniref:asparagine synthase (glutamine-hydrolyzing) n=1 Tax=Acetatifactor muris TaxID=879566 RepID=A0A2K4ZG66_9FIRM|nr:asparagine synthase (glutamine-hydrolyzing) [Acetatifactor muris]MCR2045720.1 asparagine synthase (glutamine-hydrolyzing) [Acetatifactor muris]SOY29458.1 Asparagine synthetase [glutamine-hydrolyzing] 1 [Acetatifactor muris]